MPALNSHTHCQVAQSQPHEPKLVKEYVFANADRRKKKVRPHNNGYT